MDTDRSSVLRISFQTRCTYDWKRIIDNFRLKTQQSSINATPSYPISLRSVLLLSSRLRLGLRSLNFRSDFRLKYYTFLTSLRAYWSTSSTYSEYCGKLQVYYHSHSLLRAGIAQSVWCCFTGWTNGIWFRAGGENFSLHYRVQTGSRAHPASYPMGIGWSFPGSKAAGAWSWPPPSSAEVKSTWSYTHRDNIILTIIYQVTSKLLLLLMLMNLSYSWVSKFHALFPLFRSCQWIQIWGSVYHNVT
jgi:hypothetical protein